MKSLGSEHNMKNTTILIESQPISTFWGERYLVYARPLSIIPRSFKTRDKALKEARWLKSIGHSVRVVHERDL